jgi:hypothetical protein
MGSAHFRFIRGTGMPSTSTVGRPRGKSWTVADLYRRFGPIPFERIRQNPPPGFGSVDDVVRLNDHEDRLYELVDGILVEKTVGLQESAIACRIVTALSNFIEPRDLGVVASMRLDGGAVSPGFSIQVSELFEVTKRSTVRGKQKKNGPEGGKKNGPRRKR